MKKIIVTALLFVLCIPCFSDEGETEIYCEAMQIMTYRRITRTEYTNYGFYIDDNNKMLYYAPGHTSIGGDVVRFDENAISINNIKSPLGLIGELNINRKSGAFSFDDRENRTLIPVIIRRTGSCSKVSANNKF